ncbi:MAG: hypothetical protein M1469_03980 [Bacteroidetes bacterium]|nr:hypothetical protein [Bacteroidota bacterium]
MGTQQLLLLVLVAVVVAIGISLAITYFKSNQQDVEINEVINELNHVAASAQGWYRKPKEMAGGGSSFTGFTLQSIAQPDSNDIAKYSVVSAASDLLQLQAVGFLEFTISVNVYPDSIGPYDIVK